MLMTHGFVEGENNLTGNYNRIHFIGIGGSGMSAIAKVMLHMGYTISGSDLKASDALLRLKEAGAKVYIGHEAVNVEDSDMVVISSAIPKSNPEYVRAEEMSIPVVHRADMLSLLMTSKRGIAITGAHGKTTTTSMISMILEKGGLDPTVVIGGELNDIGGNATLGFGEYLVAEADESDGSFIKLLPYIGVVTNIENDHMDYYLNMDNMRTAFEKFIGNIKDGGFAVLCNDNSNVRQIMKDIDKSYFTYGLDYPSDYVSKNIHHNGMGSSFDVYFRGNFLVKVELHVPGLHNISNAVAGVAVGHQLGVGQKCISDALETFKGVQRRFQVIGDVGGVKIIDDYSHHPTEIKAALKAARLNCPRKIYSVFQPHRYTRTRLLSEDFGKAFEDSDEVIVTRLYSAGEVPIEGVSSRLIFDAVEKAGKKAVYIDEKRDISDFLVNKLLPGDYVLTIGAGDICDVAYSLTDKLNKKFGSEEVLGNIPEVK